MKLSENIKTINQIITIPHHDCKANCQCQTNPSQVLAKTNDVHDFRKSCPVIIQKGGGGPTTLVHTNNIIITTITIILPNNLITFANDVR